MLFSFGPQLGVGWGGIDLDLWRASNPTSISDVYFRIGGADNVTALGLAVGHYQQSQVQWNGNNGETIFYQSEDPYDVPSQSSWTYNGANGYPSYEVTSKVCSHTAYVLGIYSFFDVPNVTNFQSNANPRSQCLGN